MKTIAFSGSNSSRSINQKLVNYISEQINETEIEVIKLTDYKLPMFSEDEETKGFPEDLTKLHQKIQEADFLIISTPEHNGILPAFFKNVIDWLSRLDYSFLKGKKVFVMSASPGKQGGAGALHILKKLLPHFGAEIIGEFSLGNFQENFNDGNRGVKDMKSKLSSVLVESLDKLHLAV